MDSVLAGSGLVAAARGAVDAAQERPADALAVALGVLARADDNLEAQAVACWAAGFAHRELNHLPDAEAFLARAVNLALVLGRRDILVGARITRALALANLGRADDGLAELDLALPDAQRADLGRVQMQRALILQRQGRLAEALAGFAAALPELIAAGDRLAEIRLRVNRAIALGYRDEFAAAEDDLQRAREMAAELGQRMQGAACAHNLGFICGRRGDVPAALGWFETAAAEYADLGVESGLAAVLLVDRATVLLDAGLPVEAGRAVARAVDLLEPTGNSTELAEAQLLAARAALAADDLAVAAQHAQQAATAFAAEHRPTWAVLAEWVHTQASPTAVRTAADVARRLAEAGLTVEAAAAHGRAGQLALEEDMAEFATAELAEAALSRTAAPAAARVAGWHAEALRQRVLGNRRASRRAVRLGLAELHRHRATLGATDLRAHAASYGEQLAALAVADALENGRGGDLLDAAELWRAGALTTPAVPPDEPELAALLGQLRAAAARRRAEPGPDADQQLRRVEDAVRDLVRSRPGASRAAALPPLDRATLARQLGDRMLVEWVAHRGILHAVVVSGGRTRHFALGELDELTPMIAVLRMCLHRLAVRPGSSRSHQAARETIAAVAPNATRALFGPLVRRLADQPVVLVPTGPLHAVPWLALESVRAVPTAVAPSARTWLAASARQPRPGLLLAAGPDLPGAAAEITALAAAVPDAEMLDPAHATVTAVLSGLARHGVAHLAAHGTFRSDNPQFSSLRLSDGELTVYDLETLPRTPNVVVLSACDAAATGVRAGDELLGLSAAVLALGTRSLVAPLVPIRDDVTAPLMVTLQRALAGGMDAPTAVCHALEYGDQDDHAGFATARSFITWGA